MSVPKRISPVTEYKLTGVCKECYNNDKTVTICWACDELRCFCKHICPTCKTELCLTCSDHKCTECDTVVCVFCLPDCCICGKEGEELNICGNCMIKIDNKSVLSKHICPTCNKSTSYKTCPCCEITTIIFTKHEPDVPLVCEICDKGRCKKCAK